MDIYATEMSTLRIKKGVPYVTLWVSGPRGGGKTMLRFDLAEAAELAMNLMDEVRKVREAA